MDWTFGVSPALRKNPEFQSAVVRIAIWTFGFAYIGAGGITGYYKVDIPRYIILSSAYLLCCVGLLLSVLRRPFWELRRYFSLALDITATSLAIFLTREAISPFYLIYIWIFISASTRYGRAHLVVAAVAAVVSYNIVLILLDEWQRHTFEAFFFLLLLVLLPLFQYALLRKLQQARTEAERANRAKGDFLARMTHELRTPLTGVIGMTELLQSTQLDAEQRDYVQSIAGSAEILGALIGDILDLSKIDARKLTLESTLFDPGRTVQEVCGLVEGMMLDKRLDLILDIAPDVPRQVSGDPLRVHQILLNLLGNAIKFTEKGEVLMQVSVSPPACGIDRPHLLFVVQDTGIGIAPEKMDAIFDSFQQADHSTTRQYGGSGLGTTIARELALLMGGDIGAESEAGKGSRFWVRLPFDGVALPSREQPPGTRLSGLKALVFEANATARGMMRSACIAEGMECVFVAEDAQPDQDTLCAMGQPPTLIIVADTPGGIDLESMLNRLQRPFDAAIPALFLTYRTRHPGKLGQAVHRLNKPYRADALLNAIARVLGRQDAENSPPSRAVEIIRGQSKESGSIRILVAEDNEISAKVILTFLTKLGFQAVRAHDGEEALEHARGQRFHIAFIDLRMPKLDGLQFTRAYRKLEKGRHLPIVALTANAAEEIRKECLAAGMDDFLSKPVKQAQLKQMVARLVPEARES